MAKFIKYKFLAVDGDKNPINKVITCKTQENYNANYPIAEKEAVGEIIVEGEFDPETDTASTDDVLNALLGVTER